MSTATDYLRAHAAGHPVLDEMVTQWRRSRREDQLEDQLARRMAELDELRATVDSITPHILRPAAPRYQQVKGLVTGYEHADVAWRACMDANLIPASWLDDPRRRFIDDDGNVIGHPCRISDVIALASDRDGVVAAEDALRQLAAARAPWGHHIPDEHYWSRGEALVGIGRAELADVADAIDVDLLWGDGITGLIGALAIASVVWRDPDTQLSPYRRGSMAPTLLEQFHFKPSAMLPDPFAAVLSLLRTGYWFELGGEHTLVIPDPPNSVD